MEIAICRAFLAAKNASVFAGKAAERERAGDLADTGTTKEKQ